MQVDLDPDTEARAEFSQERMFAVNVITWTAHYQHFDCSNVVLKNLCLGDIELGFEYVIHAAYPTSIWSYDVILNATVNIKEDVASATTWARMVGSSADISHAIANQGCCGIGQSRHEERASNPISCLLLGLDLDDAEFHIDMEPLGVALGHGCAEFADAVAITDRRSEGLFDRRALEGEQGLGGGETRFEAAARDGAPRIKERACNQMHEGWIALGEGRIGFMDRIDIVDEILG